MHILCLGLNHTTAPIGLRERLALNEDETRAALARIACGHLSSSINELLILSTCNRIELYAASDRPAFAELESFLSDARAVPLAEFQAYLYRRVDLEAVDHLFRVSAGLDSLVVGEPQILGQVTRSIELARGQNTAGPLLNRLFQAAIRTGKRARTETNISRNPASVSSLAASVAEKAVGDIRSAHVVVVGAGEMAEITVEVLRKRGVRNIRVINRTLARAQELARRWSAGSGTFEFLEEALSGADIVISSTGAPHTILTRPMIQQVMASRPARPLVLIDIALPRDIDSDTGELPGVQLLDMDGLNTQLEHSLSERMAQIPLVEGILDEELRAFSDFLQSLEILPLIAGLYEHAESIRQAELEKTLRRMPDLTDAQRARLEAMTHALVKKLLEKPTHRLRAQAASPGSPEYALVARSLFGLDAGEGADFAPSILSTAAD
ncbi:MAG: glutamyl-tRNA reductase [Bacteroidota bacterium]